MRKLTIAERQRRLDRICKIAEYIVPIVVSSVASVVFSLMVLR